MHITIHEFSPSLSLSLSLLVFIVEEVLVGEADERLSPIEGEDAVISIPMEVFGGLGGEERVRMASFLFRNMSGLLPENLEGTDNRCMGL